METFWVNYKIISSDGYSQPCESESEAQCEADRLSEEKGQPVWVLKLLQGKVVYAAGSDDRETDN